MFARMLKASLKPNQVAEFDKTFDKDILPMLRKAKGFQDAITFVGPSGSEVATISLWDSKENAEAYNSVTYPEVLKLLAAVLEGTPQVRTYEVTNSTFHKITPHATV